MNKMKVIHLIAGVLFFSTCLVPAAYAEEDYLPVADEAFYVPPTDLSGYERGDLIRWETEPDMDASLTERGTPYRVMYVTKGSSGEKIAATGMVFIPIKNKKPLDAVVWAHGTVGVGDSCAPSKWPLLYPTYRWPTYGIPTREILNEGFAAIAPDYEGLGTPGLAHPWMNAESAGNAIIDSVRAYRNLAAKADYEITNRWGVWGHSQGAFAARAANILANQVAPELSFVGSVEVSGIDNADISNEFVENVAVTALGAFPYLGYAAHGVRALYPEFEPKNFLGPLFLQEVEIEPGVSVPLFELAGELCYEDWIFGLLDMVGFDLPDDVIRNPNYVSDPATQKWVTDIAFGGFGIDDYTLESASGPAYIIVGELDDLFSPSMKKAYLKGLDLTDGIKYQIVAVPDSGHDVVLEETVKDTLKWLSKRFKDFGKK